MAHGRAAAESLCTPNGAEALAGDRCALNSAAAEAGGCYAPNSAAAGAGDRCALNSAAAEAG
eukprot:2487476-Pleurochrysis_carterae.AAC.1